MTIPPSATVDAVFVCIDQATAGNGDRGTLFDPGYAVRDVKTGVLESTHYRTPNVSGFRLRAEVSTTTASVDLSLRGAGAYCADLGVDKEMARLTSDVTRCLQR